jgi:pilus assembly protein FimV
MFSRGDAVSLPVAPRGEGYVVKAGDTLATIAAAVRPAGVSLEQMIVALYQANEAAFLDGNMNRIRASAALTPPAEDAARAIDPAFARSSILEHRAAFEAYQRRLAGAAAARTPAAAATGAPAAPAPSAAAPGDRLRLSRGDERKAGAADGAAREDDLAALQRALGETKERIAALEKNVADLTALLTLRNRELARLQRDAQVTGRQFASLATDSDAPRDPAEPDDARSLVQSLAAHANWLAAALVLGFVAWVLMPFKTLRLWLKRRRRAARQARRVRARVRRAAHRAGLLPSSALSSV